LKGAKQMIKHLILSIAVGVLLVSCIANRTNTPTPTVEGKWENLPIMPNAVGNSEPSALTGYPYTIYRYTTDADINAAESFYLDAMNTAGWELLGKGDMSSQDFKGMDLWYSKGDKVVTIQIWVRNNTTNVALVPEQ
jgi:hypothetical protein